MGRDTYERLVTDRDEDTFGGEIIAAESPATTLVASYMLLTLVVGVTVGTILYTNPDLFGEDGYARLAGLVVFGLTILGLIRLAISYVVLRRTTYVVTPDSVRREYKLAYREQARELPLHMIRGVEVTKSRMQSVLGYATISFLAVGSNRGIGYVEFDNAADPETLQEAVLELLETQRERAAEETTSEPVTTQPPGERESDSGSDGADDFGRTDPIDGSDEPTGTEPDDADQGAESEAATIFDSSNDASGSGDAVSEDDASDDVTGTGDPLGEDDPTDDARRPVSGNDTGRDDSVADDTD